MPNPKMPTVTPDDMLNLLFAAIAHEVQANCQPDDLLAPSKFRGLLVRSLKTIAGELEPHADKARLAPTAPKRIGFTG